MNRPPFYTRKKKEKGQWAHCIFHYVVGTPGREGRTSRLPPCNCLFHTFLWMKDFSKEFYSVLPAPASSCRPSCIMHSKKKKYSPFSQVCPSHCGARIWFTSSSRQSCSWCLTIAAQVVFGSVLSFCMWSVWTVLISGNLQVENRSEILRLKLKFWEWGWREKDKILWVKSKFLVKMSRIKSKASGIIGRYQSGNKRQRRLLGWRRMPF